MELPNIGVNCMKSECNVLDFLPITCQFCGAVFCQHHFQPVSHNCQHVAISKHVGDTSLGKNPVCSLTGCTTSDSVEMLCVKCKLHFCLAHRYHDCFKLLGEEEIEEARRRINLPREQFAQSLQKVSAQIDENIEKSKKTARNRATALKVQLMRLKGKAKGEPDIPALDRAYFLIFPPLQFSAKPKALYVSKKWTLGRIVDSASSISDVPNKNHIASASKLRIFRKSDGLQATNDMSQTLSNLFEKDQLADGESLILEYVSPNEAIDEFIIPNPQLYSE